MRRTQQLNTTDFKDKRAIGSIEEPAEGAWQAWVLEQDAVWVDKNGLVYLIADLPFPYVVNILRFIYREHNDGFLGESPLVGALLERLVTGDA